MMIFLNYVQRMLLFWRGICEATWWSIWLWRFFGQGLVDLLAGGNALGKAISWINPQPTHGRLLSPTSICWIPPTNHYDLDRRYCHHTVCQSSSSSSSTAEKHRAKGSKTYCFGGNCFGGREVFTRSHPPSLRACSLSGSFFLQDIPDLLNKLLCHFLFLLLHTFQLSVQTWKDSSPNLWLSYWSVGVKQAVHPFPRTARVIKLLIGPFQVNRL